MIPYEGVAEQVIALEVDAASEPVVEAGTMVALSGNGKVKACPASTAARSPPDGWAGWA